MHYIDKQVREVGGEGYCKRTKLKILANTGFAKNFRSLFFVCFFTLWKPGLIKPMHEVRVHSLLYGGVCFVFKQSGGLIHWETNTNFVEK